MNLHHNRLHPFQRRAGGVSTRSQQGFSLLEALVSLVIVGVAIAGMTELLWANTSWLSMLHNKFDTFYAAKRFLSELEIDARQSAGIENGSDSTHLILTRAAESDFDSYGFLTRVSEYHYWVEADSEIGSEGKYVVKAGADYPTVGRIVLRGVTGPKGIADGLPKIFQYLNRGGDGTPISVAQNSTRMLLVNLEVKRTEFGKAKQDGPLKSGIAIHQEIFLRNAYVHGQ
ncbi:MAG: prepilin-type N-terminal cleavage/methylation domain-containing protein [Candidatus Obscuribacter sp.]|nr:prepilin-type N-terminal cleavage/methylation domain-containing protein [Candidatus Obscuribacter sp.]MBK9281523.1 prepilin-type N-terminal cleavage/methylation domain-containing protein [Candidatus Obscuribacter sp.]